MTVTLVRVVQTCMACPSQWDGWDAEGYYYYLRFRTGHGSITRYGGPNGEGSDEAWNHFDGVLISEFSYGHPLDGFLTLEEFAHLAGIGLAPALMRTSFGEHIRDELILDGTLSPRLLEGPEADT